MSELKISVLTMTEKMLFSGEIYTTGKNLTLPLAVTNLTSEVPSYFWCLVFHALTERNSTAEVSQFGREFFSILMGNSPF